MTRLDVFRHIMPVHLSVIKFSTKEIIMILVRTVFQAKVGRAGILAEAFKKSLDNFPLLNPRVLTDLSGPTDTVVLEVETESLDEYFRSRAEMFADPQFAELSAKVVELLESGRNEYYTIEN